MFPALVAAGGPRKPPARDELNTALNRAIGEGTFVAFRPHRTIATIGYEDLKLALALSFGGHPTDGFIEFLASGMSLRTLARYFRTLAKSLAHPRRGFDAMVEELLAHYDCERLVSLTIEEATAEIATVIGRGARPGDVFVRNLLMRVSSLSPGSRGSD